jgi:hypothetical protein
MTKHYKHIIVEDAVHYEISLYKSKNKHKNYSTSIKELLDKAEGVENGDTNNS